MRSVSVWDGESSLSREAYLNAIGIETGESNQVGSSLLYLWVMSDDE